MITGARRLGNPVEGTRALSDEALGKVEA